MSDQPSHAPDAGALRQQAEQRLREQQRLAQPPLDLSDTRALVHELQVHQIELEMQNEELRRAQVELVAAQARYFDLYDLAPVGYVTVSEEGLILEANLNAAALLSVPRSALVQQPFAGFIFKEDQTIYYWHRQQLWAADSPQTCELRMVQLGGTIIWARLESASTPDAAGAPVSRVVLSDITERKRAEAALSAGEERYRLLAETMLQGVVHQSADGAIIAMNPAAERILGWSREEFLGRSSVKVEQQTIRENGEVFPGLEHPAMVALRSGQPVSGVVMGVFNPKLGDYRWIRIDAVPVYRSGETQPGEVYAVFADITEHKRNEETLRASQERHRTILQTAMDGLWVVDAQGRLLEANATYSRMSGYSVPELLALRISDLEAAEESAVVAAHIEKVVARGEDRFESRHRRKDGTIFEVEISVQYRPTEGGRFVAFLRDISDRKRIEQALMESEAQFRQLFEQSPDAVFLEAADGTVLDVNPAACQLQKMTREQLLGQNVLALVPADLRDNVAKQFRRWFTGELTFYEGFTRLHDGRSVPVEIRGAVVLHQGQKAVQLHVRDITERKATEQALRLSETRLKLAQQAGRVGTFERNLQTGEIIWSEELEALYGLPRGGFEGTYADWQQRVLPADRPAVQEELARAVAQRGDFQVEYRVLWPDGTIHWLAAAGKVVADERGKPARTLGTTLDITGRKVAEAALRRDHDELERRVQERTADLNQTVTALQAEIVSRQQAEAALSDSEERYRTLFQAAPVGIGISNHRGEVLACNLRLAEMAGVTAEEFCARPATDFYAVPAQRRRLLAEVRRTGRVAEREEALQRPDGTKLVGRMQMNEIQMGRERVLLTLVQDITQQKETEQRVECIRGLLELFATKSSLKEYLSAVVKRLRDWCGCRAVGVRLLDASGRIPFAAHVGFTSPFLRSEKELSLPTDDCACVRIVMGRARPEDVPCTSVSGSFFCNHTSQFAAHLPAAPAPRSAVACLSAGYKSLAHAAIRYRGEIIGTIQLADLRAGQFPVATIAFIESVAPLIGEAIHRFQVEAALQESEARFRTLFERHGSVMLLLEPQSGALVDANAAAAEFYGHSRDALRTMNIADLNALPRSAQATHGCLTLRGQRSMAVFPHRLAGGKIRTVEVHASPISIQGRRLSFLIIHDITERMLLEKQVLEISEQERQRVGQDLHDTLGGRLTGTALLVKALAQGLARRGQPEAALAEEVVRSINESIAETRAIARGLCPMELSVTGLHGGLTELAEETRRQSGLACLFRGDQRVQVRDLYVATHLFQIAREAVTNALRHAHAWKINIRLTGNAGQIYLEVRDDGTGLPTPVEPTTGLGLQTMRYRARAIGAHLAIRSLRHGTVVSCRLPAGQAESTGRMTND